MNQYNVGNNKTTKCMRQTEFSKTWIFQRLENKEKSGKIVNKVMIISLFL